MEYDIEDYNFIKSWLDKCIKIEQNDSIYYITSNNILRQLKYNKLYNENKEIKVDLNKINFKDNIILEQDLKNKYLNVNYWKIWSVFDSKCNYNYQETNKFINGILGDILNCKEYSTKINFEKQNKQLGDILNCRIFNIFLLY